MTESLGLEALPCHYCSWSVTLGGGASQSGSNQEKNHSYLGIFSGLNYLLSRELSSKNCSRSEEPK